ncbi:ThuA domain-containing protein [Actinophytocola algeriensis]|uniref:PKD repeat protein/type 1 glutamine amidotransferase n=1 Tax=Actinophytocola algeriensis TaxID=1768010 RepID=A0A7W7VJS8_9PSEU|nr:ThuA domain-containing protein [Actinophytocola algeriensis]MBB4912808.1 PKD repeat protein/type 1 glutamine amidotransferase [Actinophytocola algeriensis]MBE1474158.1 PKD repeat protein/type 1 glutamine amidotransferase [Actinophytocola algeriensis]
MRHTTTKLLIAFVSALLVLAMNAPAAPAGPAAGEKVLLFTKTAGFRHDSIPAGVAMFQQMAADNAWQLTHTEDSAVFTDATLATYDVVIMFQTSGMVWTTAAQRAAMQTYLRNGGGIVAIHNATDMNIESEFPWWDQMLGMTMTQHSAIVAGTAKVADQAHPSGQGLPQRWNRTEEWYNFNRSARGDVHVLVTADETTYNPGSSAMGADHPISWCRNVEGGRLWATAMGHQASAYSEPLFRSHVLGGVRTAAGTLPADCGPTVWASYDKVELDSNTVAPGTLDVAQDGRVFYTQYGGQLKIYKPSTRTTVTAGTLNVYTGGEDGLAGVALDPGFATNRWVYLYYSPAGSQEINRVSRFTVNGDTLDLASERILLSFPAARQSEPGHTGGYLTFGPGGNLYIGVGDDTNPHESSGYTPIDERSGRSLFDAQKTAANTNDLRGKILRIHPESGGTYTIPSGNMFAPGTAQTRPEIYAMGFRNPFRFTVDTDGTIYLADYGPDAGSDNANRGPGGLVEWNVITSPGYYGWPYCVANNIPFTDYNFANNTSGAKFNCAAPVNSSPNNTGLTTLPAARPATVWYGNGSNGNAFPEMGGGGEAPMAFPVYHYDPANPSPTKFPQYFDKTPFFGEWARNTMHEFRLDSSRNLLKINRFLANLTFRSPMDAKFGPDGSLYLLEWGSGFGRDNPDSALYRIDYISGDRAPLARATAAPSSGGSPLTVSFSSAGSADPEGGPLTYRWTFGDGGSSTSANPSHTYTARGLFNAQLTVTDPNGRTGVANVPVTVGNTAPTVRLTTPPHGGMFDFGDEIPYSVSVTDPEDGTIDCARVITTAALGHDEHAHPLDPQPGCSGVLATHSDGGHSPGSNLFYVADAVYTDNGAAGVPALTGRTQVVLQPKHKQAEHFTGSSGIRVVAQAGAEGGQRIGDIGNNDWISFTPMNLTGINQVSFRVSSPGPGGTIELRSGSPTGALVATATVGSTGGWDNYVSLAPVAVTRPAGTVELFVVFKSTSATTYDLDSITFVGPGVGTPGAVTSGPIVGSSGKCVDVNGASTADGAKIQLWTCNSGTNQQWTRDGGTLRALGKCMTVAGGGTADGALVQSSACNGGAAQNWTPQAGGSLVNPGSGKCLDANGAGSADGTQLIIWTCHGGANQRWTLP